MKKTACFTGHREIKGSHFLLKRKLKKTIISLIETKNVKYFGIGGALGFDTMAADVIISLKKVYPDISMILVIPYLGQSLHWAPKDRDKHSFILSKADKVVVLSEKYYDGCYFVRNRHLVNHSDYCICYLRKNTGGTQYTFNYAKEKNLEIFLI